MLLHMLNDFKVLELHENEIRQLPNEIGRLSKLYMLTVKDNYLDIDISGNLKLYNMVTIFHSTRE